MFNMICQLYILQDLMHMLILQPHKPSLNTPLSMPFTGKTSNHSVRNCNTQITNTRQLHALLQSHSHEHDVAAPAAFCLSSPRNSVDIMVMALSLSLNATITKPMFTSPLSLFLPRLSGLPVHKNKHASFIVAPQSGRQRA